MEIGKIGPPKIEDTSTRLSNLEKNKESTQKLVPPKVIETQTPPEVEELEDSLDELQNISQCK